MIKSFVISKMKQFGLSENPEETYEYYVDFAKKFEAACELLYKTTLRLVACVISHESDDDGVASAVNMIEVLEDMRPGSISTALYAYNKEQSVLDLVLFRLRHHNDCLVVVTDLSIPELTDDDTKEKFMYMVDYCKRSERLLVWIDHHKMSKETLEIVQSKLSDSFLCVTRWDAGISSALQTGLILSLHESAQKRFVPIYSRLTYLLEVSKYDTFAHIDDACIMTRAISGALKDEFVYTEPSETGGVLDGVGLWWVDRQIKKSTTTRLMAIGKSLADSHILVNMLNDWYATKTKFNDESIKEVLVSVLMQLTDYTNCTEPANSRGIEKAYNTILMADTVRRDMLSNIHEFKPITNEFSDVTFYIFKELKLDKFEVGQASIVSNAFFTELSKVKDVNSSVIVWQNPYDGSISFRSFKNELAKRLATAFGGGGHGPAAGTPHGEHFIETFFAK